jgi:hypothetical protein
MEKENEYKFATIDFETDPFKYGRFPCAFACGFFDGHVYSSVWGKESVVIRWAINRIKRFEGIVYAHNGGRFDFLGILFKQAGADLHGEPVRCIGGRVVQMRFGSAELRDSYAILPAPLRSYDKGDIDYAKLEASCRHKHKREILDYLSRDVQSLHKLVKVFLLDHGIAPLTAASAGMRFSKKLGIDIERFNDTDDAKFRKWYSGGLVLARKPGIHHGNFKVYDIKSAYPYAMVHPHSSGRDFDFISRPRQIQGNDFVMYRGTANDAFLRRDGQSSRWGGDGDFYVTGFEYLEANRRGKLRGHALFVERPQTTLDFKPYVSHFFDSKQRNEREGNKAGRLIDKIMLNALYGKFAQRPDRYRDYVLMPAGEPTCGEWEEESVYDECGFSVWSRPAKAYGYYNVSTAASITGFVRAMLMRALYENDPHYCDTDSIISNTPFVAGINGNGELGSWSLETEGDLLYIAGKKLYALRILRSICATEADAIKNGYQWHRGRAWKIASKGCRLTPDQMKSICEGKKVVYKNDAPSYSLLNSPFFVKRTIRATAIQTT